jgi:hypothetical protein
MDSATSISTLALDELGKWLPAFDKIRNEVKRITTMHNNRHDFEYPFGFLSEYILIYFLLVYGVDDSILFCVRREFAILKSQHFGGKRAGHRRVIHNECVELIVNRGIRTRYSYE